jgi:homogentisate 1,2-dioxygenase
MMESSQMFTLTDYAMKRSGKLHGQSQSLFASQRFTNTMAVHNPSMWDNLDAQFLNHIDAVNKDLKDHGLPVLQK